MGPKPPLMRGFVAGIWWVCAFNALYFFGFPKAHVFHIEKIPEGFLEVTIHPYAAGPGSPRVIFADPNGETRVDMQAKIEAKFNISFAKLLELENENEKESPQKVLTNIKADDAIDIAATSATTAIMPVLKKELRARSLPVCIFPKIFDCMPTVRL